MANRKPIYLDYCATTPCDPAVVEAMLPFFTTHFGNASSASHRYGWEAAEAVQIAREQIAELIHASPDEILFTSGATEALNLAIQGLFTHYHAKGNHLITCTTEHHAVLDTMRFLEQYRGAKVTYLSVNANGKLDLEELKNAITDQTLLICLMYANNETGVLHPVKSISEIAHRYGIPFLTDATQAAGILPMDVEKDGIDLMAISAHKMYGPKGAGALYVRKRFLGRRLQLVPLLHGGGQEKGMRSGTLNVPAIVGFGKAAELVMQHRETEYLRLQQLRDRLEKALVAAGCIIHGSTEPRLPHVTHVHTPGIPSRVLIPALAAEIALSAGSACSSATGQPSHVLKAMGMSDEEAFSSLRISVGRFTTEEELQYSIQLIGNAIERLRQAD
ncbi:cysteine desulfurase family protein [Thermoflavifilum thermophilum]|uniref:cysteine desulfurase n=1 Tax=Thermoflavifilum thermophilum TaxID=1393122 RepID=A0A1I7NDY2_9BACT|nr:cysteine desulfurase family protein [Thermoflavifilum thermophilum]SFV32887.1 cysteine desulfurase [Thermoflavifilum thermophilum]